MDRFEDSFERLFARSYRVASRILGGSAEAEDIAADRRTTRPPASSSRRTTAITARASLPERASAVTAR